MSWINLSALWKIVVFGLIAGAGLPALFAGGLYALSLGPRPRTGAAAGADGGTTPTCSSAAASSAWCSPPSAFLIILAAIGWGVYEIYTARPPRPEEVTVRPPQEGSDQQMALPRLPHKIVDWLRAGYPEGVPEHDYIPLFALLGSQLTNDEVTLIADELAVLRRPRVGGGDQEGDRRRHPHHAERRRHRPGPRAPRGGRLAAGRAAPGLGQGRLPRQLAAVPGEGAGGAAVGQRDRPDDAGGALGSGPPAAPGAVRRYLAAGTRR